TPDCSIERCTYCGACDFTKIRNVTYHVRGAKGGEHRGDMIDNWAQMTVGDEESSGSWEPRGWQKIQDKAARKLAPSGVAADAPAAGHDVPPLGNVASNPSIAAAAREAAGTRPAARGLGNAEEWLNAGTEALAPAVAILPAAMRARLTYAKRGRARFISHLELIEIFDRACRRAKLPLAFSQGFRPSPKLRFSPGLPVGAESDCEVLDVDLTAELPIAEVAARFGAHLPEGLLVTAAESIALHAPSPEHDLAGFRYRVDVRDIVGDDGDAIDTRLAAFLAAEAFPLRKRTGHGEKTIDARQLVSSLARVAPHVIEIDVRFTAAGSLKPTELLGALFDLAPDMARALPLYKTHAFYAPTIASSPADSLPTSA
ncbi:MAG: TIGR03936 family radical SAM-associated protein, partial [bacterium]